MRRGRTSLAILSMLVGTLVVGATAVATRADAQQEMTVYRCEADGKVTLQDEPCPAGQTQTTRSMTRPKDPPPRPASAPVAAPPVADRDPGPLPREPGPYPLPPPPMFQCTDYDGEVRFTEEYDPNTRCVPLAVLGYDLGPYPNAQTCSWVHESCLRLDDHGACIKFREKLKAEKSEALHASTSEAPYHDSEVERLSRIVAESCR